MPIRFRCDRCGQKLRVADEKVGQQARCPKCQAGVTVPVPQAEDQVAPSVPASSTSPPAPPDDPADSPEIPGGEPVVEPRLEAPIPHAPVPRSEPTVPIWRAHPVPLDTLVKGPNWSGLPEGRLPEIVLRDDGDDDVEPLAPRSEVVVDYDKVAVPRRLLYAQGLLLGLVAVASFALGMFVKQPAAAPVAAFARPPATLTGQITYGEDHQPDAGAVVVVLPTERRPLPDSRFDVTGLRPTDPLPLDEHPTIRAIRALGGEHARANNQGAFQVRLPQTGRYHVLLISRRSPRRAQDRVEMTDVAQMGRYFDAATDLLADRQYRWRTMTLTGSDSIDAEF